MELTPEQYAAIRELFAARIAAAREAVAVAEAMLAAMEYARVVGR